MKTREIKFFLEKRYMRYHRPAYLRLDPLCCLRGFRAKKDLELAGLVAAALAYGRVEIIIRNVSDIFSRTGRSIARFAAETTLERKRELFKDFKHRFHDGYDIALLLHCAADLQRKHGSLESLFLEGLASGHTTVKNALDRLVFKIRGAAAKLAPERKKSMAWLLPSPASGSACKRLNMYLRWMARPSDGIDLGVWEKVGTVRLLIPVDTHVARIARRIGLTKRATADWKMAEEITAGLRSFDAFDPVRYDFSLCRAGMVGFRRKAA
jgi:uncharacterized protein (TIGR02757 family)